MHVCSDVKQLKPNPPTGESALREGLALGGAGGKQHRKGKMLLLLRQAHV